MKTGDLFRYTNPDEEEPLDVDVGSIGLIVGALNNGGLYYVLINGEYYLVSHHEIEETK